MLRACTACCERALGSGARVKTTCTCAHGNSTQGVCRTFVGPNAVWRKRSRPTKVLVLFCIARGAGAAAAHLSGSCRRAPELRRRSACRQTPPLGSPGRWPRCRGTGGGSAKPAEAPRWRGRRQMSGTRRPQSPAGCTPAAPRSAWGDVVGVVRPLRMLARRGKHTDWWRKLTQGQTDDRQSTMKPKPPIMCDRL